MKLSLSSDTASLAKNTLTMEGAFLAQLAFTPLKALYQLNLVKSARTTLSAWEAVWSLLALASGVRVPPVSISSTATILRPALAQLKVTSILKATATKATRAYCAPSASQAMSEMPSSSVLSAPSNGRMCSFLH